MNFKQIASYDNYMLANMTLGMLQENEINCHLKDEHIVTIDPLLNPAVGGIKILVAETDYERALEIIKKAEEDYIKDIPCPNCQSHSLSVEEKISNPENFWGKLKNQIAYGQTSTYRKQYRCKNCNRIFTELPASF
ncbi:MAG: DUF2007 domain-containing protein [Ferruginibacter sp.]